MSPSLQEWLPEGHLARFIADVTKQLDLSAIYAVYERRDGRGQAGYHPLLLLRLLLYGYCSGVVSSRAIERKTQAVGFRYLCGPSTSRSRHDCRFPPAALGDCVRAVPANSAVVPESRADQTGSRGAGGKQNPGEREAA